MLRERIQQVPIPLEERARMPPEVSEVEMVGFTTAPSNAVKPPRIAEAPVAFECRLWEKLETDSRYIFIGKVLWLHAREGLIDLEKYRVRLQDYFPVARFGASFYINTRERYALGDRGQDAQAARVLHDGIGANAGIDADD